MKQFYIAYYLCILWFMTHFKRKKRTRVFSCASECERVFVRGYVCVCMRARVTCNERMVSFLKLFEVYYVIFLDKIHHKNLHACLDHVHISKLACQGYSLLFVFNQLNLINNWIKTYSFIKRIYISYLFISISLMEFTFFLNDHVSFKIIESHNKKNEITRFHNI